jgi:DNA replication protein DnaC
VSALYEELAGSGLVKLGLSVASAQLDTAAQQAAASSWSYSHFLGYLLDGELRHRHANTVRLSLQFAKLPYLKRIEDFDFSAQPSVDRRLIEELATLRFVEEGRNVVLLGPPGVGKTHIAIALGVKVAEAGHRIYFTTAIDLSRRMARAMAENRLTREIHSLVRPKLLIIDEVGYLSLEPQQASLFFQAISERYERNQPVVLTSNKAFSDWGQVFSGDAIMASAAPDRLLHRSTVIQVRGDSYRLREKRLAAESAAGAPVKDR